MSTPGGVWQQEEVVTGFIDERRKLIPLFDVQEQLVRRLMTRGGRQISRFCDLGAGDGGFAELVLDAFPGSTGVLVDFSEPMLAAAQQRLAGKTGRWEIVRGDLSTPQWRHSLPADAAYDAIVSRLAIHHLPDERKRHLYTEAFRMLSPGGLFLNWEHIETGGLAEGLFDEYFRERMEHAGHDVASYDDAADDDVLCEPETQCDWLRGIGFDQVDTYFKLPGLAIFGGTKPWNR